MKNNLAETLRNRFQATKLNDRPVCLHSQNTKHVKAHPLKQRLHRFRVSVGAISSYCATRAAKVGNGGNQYPFQSNTEMKSGPKTSNPHNTPGESTAQPKKYQTTLHTATRAGEAWHCLSCASHNRCFRNFRVGQRTKLKARSQDLLTLSVDRGLGSPT